MLKKHLLQFAFLLVLLALNWGSISAQCNTFAGNATPTDLSICQTSATITVPPVTGAVLGTGEFVNYVVHSGTPTQLGSILATGFGAPQFSVNLPPGEYAIAAIAGNNIPGSTQVDITDPCLSVTYIGKLTVRQAHQVNIFVYGKLSCFNTSVNMTSSVGGGSGGPFTFQWSTVPTSTAWNITVYQPGTYTATVTDQSSGCTAVGYGTVEYSSGNLLISATDPSGCDANPATQTLNAGISSDIIGYLWSTGATTSTIDVPNLPAGATYSVTLTGNGCVDTGQKFIPYSEGFDPQITLEDQYFSCSDSNSIVWLTTNVAETAGATFQWSNGSQDYNIYPTVSGLYTVTVSLPAFGCAKVASYYYEKVNCSQVEGHIWADMNGNCLQDAGDLAFPNAQVQITDANSNIIYGYTYNDGSWYRGLEPGTYTVEVISPSGLWTTCTPIQTVTLTGSDTISIDFLLQPQDLCPRLEVEIATGLIRRCSTAYYSVLYKNTGSTSANGAYIDLALDDDLLFTSASLPSSGIGNNTYRFQLGNVAPLTNGTFQVTVGVKCDAVPGEAHCTTATSFPNDPCGPQAQNWSGASLAVSAECQSDSITFQLQNNGTANMSSALEYLIIEDAVMRMSSPPPIIILAPNEPYSVKVPANGSTWRLEATQEANHPGLSYPSVTVEGCTTNANFSTGYVTQFSQDDADWWIDIDCTENIGSYDPNDKQAEPKGFGIKQQMERNTDIEYMIRFQNTGNDTAFTVVLRDVLSPWLDPKTIIPGPSSHPYRFDFYGTGANMKFTFDNIKLPDSTTNLAASQGFVSYRVSQQKNVPFGTDIYNTADIYFDFNAPITTNTTHHRVDTSFVPLLVSTWQPVWKGAEIKVSPNPMTDYVDLMVQQLPVGTAVRFDILDANGRTVATQMNQGSTWRFQRGSLPSGLYFVRMTTDQQLIGTAKIDIR
jgi:uncharacterized repeat protein (TIGR01451 family)